MSQRERVTHVSADTEQPSAVRSVVAASPVSIEGPSGHGGDVNSLLQGLAGFNAGLSKYIDKQSDDDLSAGAAARADGAPNPGDKSAWWQHGYMVMDGKVKGTVDSSDVRSLYDTAFDKDGGDIEKFIRDQFAERTKGLSDKSFLKGYSESFGAAAEKLRAEHLAYQRGQVLQKHEANAQFLVQNFLTDYASQGKLPPPDALDSLKQSLKNDYSVSLGKFNELLFTAAEGIGDKGDPTVYELLKKDNLDGTKGMYFIPAWKEKIDAKQIHAQNVMLENANKAYAIEKRNREDKQDRALYATFDLLFSGKDKEAQTLFSQHINGGLFNRASDIVKWQEMFHKVENRELRADEETTMTSALTKVVTGEMGPRGILALSLPPKAKRQLLSEWRTNENARKANEAQGATLENAPFRDHRFREQDDYIEKQLSPVQDFLGKFTGKNEFISAARATAKLELAEWVKRNGIADSEALRKKTTEIVERHTKRIAEQGDMEIDRAAKQLRYASLAETNAAAERGELSKADYALHLKYFKSKQGATSGKQ